MRARAGFTLLEVLVALALTAVVLVVVQRAAAGALRMRAVVEDDVRTRGAVRVALLHLAGELAAAQPGSLRVVRDHPLGPPLVELVHDEPAPTRVVYRVVEHALERRSAPRFALAGAAAAAPSALLDGVQQLDVRCRDRDGWHEQWDVPTAPLAVAVTLETTDGERLTATVPVAGAGW